MCLSAIFRSNETACFDEKAKDIAIPIPVIFALLAFLSWLGSGVLILGFLCSKKLRTSGGDIVFGISVAEFILATHWLVSSFFSKNSPGGDLSTDCTFCYINAVFSVFADILSFLYNVFLCRYLLHFLRFSHKEVYTRKYHIATITAAITGVLVLAQTGGLGKTLFGTCSIKYQSKGSTAYLRVVAVFVYMGICFFTFWRIRKYAPKSESSLKDVVAFLKYYNNYILASAIIWALYTICNLIATICDQSSTPPSQKLASNVMKLVTIGSFAKILNPLVLLFIRYTDSYIRSTMISVVCPCRNKCKVSSGQGGIDIEQNNGSQPLLNHSNSIEAEEDYRWAKVKKHRKVQFTYTILSGIVYTSKKVGKTASEDGITQSEKFRNAENYLQSRRFDISLEILQKELPALDFSGYSVFKSQFTFYAPELFHGLMLQDAKFLDLDQTLDFEANRDEIMKASQAKCGKSGEFFFFSSDKKLIAKTITAKEKNRMVSILPQYVKYLAKNKNSLIAKCYGVFSLKINSENDEYHFIVMRNVSSFPKDYVEREYDVKGSTFDREVLRNEQGLTVTDLKNKGTLKDLDFFKYEKKIDIAPDLAAMLVTQMEEDGRFFCSLGLIDYSLMVFVVDRKKYEEENKKALQYHQLSSLESLSYPGLNYNIGIIDYLQVYDFGKKGERCLKRTVNANCSLNISVQPPEIYSERFGNLAQRLVYGKEKTSSE